MTRKIDQYSVYCVDLNPTQGAEMSKTRPCIVITPPEMNYYLQTIIIAPVTSRGREKYPTRISFRINNVSGWIVLDQLLAIDKSKCSVNPVSNIKKLFFSNDENSINCIY